MTYTEPNTTAVETITKTGTYFGWFNQITEYTHKNGRNGFLILEGKGELTLVGNGLVEMGDLNSGYDHYEFGAKTVKRLEEASEEGEDISEVLEELGWTEGDTKYVLVHTGELEIA